MEKKKKKRKILDDASDVGEVVGRKAHTCAKTKQNKTT